VLESLAQGVPQVAIPVTVDQPGVAARIAEKKTGLFVPSKDLTVSGLSLLLDRVLNDTTYRDNARHFQGVIAKLMDVPRQPICWNEPSDSPSKPGRLLAA
jgi:zeaxanthin glucosyltransferase